MSKTIFALLLATFCVSSHVAFGRSVESSLIRRFRRDLIGSDCASDVHRSKRSPCNPLAESSNRFNGKTFEQIREDFRSRNFIEKGETGNSFQCPVTGTQFWLDSAGKSYKSGTEYPHVDVTHPDWPGYKLKFPLGNKLTNELNGMTIETSKKSIPNDSKRKISLG